MTDLVKKLLMVSYFCKSKAAFTNLHSNYKKRGLTTLKI